MRRLAIQIIDNYLKNSEVPEPLWFLRVRLRLPIHPTWRESVVQARSI